MKKKYNVRLSVTFAGTGASALTTFGVTAEDDASAIALASERAQKKRMTVVSVDAIWYRR